MTLISFVLFSFLIACEKDKPVQTELYDIFLIMGQSNTENGYSIDPSVDRNDEGILQLGRNNGNDRKVLKAVEPLENWDPRNDRIGFGLAFAKLYKNALLAPGRKILLIPCGKGSSGFNNAMWNTGNVLYQDAVARARWVIENFPGSELKAILWQQGEQDVGNPDYQLQLDNMIVNLRMEIAGNNSTQLPFIAGGMVPYWVTKMKSRQEQEAIIEHLPDRLPAVGFANPLQPFIIKKPDDNFDTIHYDANGQRELAKRYFSAYRALVK